MLINKLGTLSRPGDTQLVEIQIQTHSEQRGLLQHFLKQQNKTTPVSIDRERL